jgi:hypothetical protein
LAEQRYHASFLFLAPERDAVGERYLTSNWLCPKAQTSVFFLEFAMLNDNFGITDEKLDITFSDLGTVQLFEFIENAGYGRKND